MFISVVVPAYNEEKYIEPCLNSLKNQNFAEENYELIVECSGSSDRTKSIALSFGAKIVDSGRLEGISWARHRGGLEAKGEVIAYTDSDVQVSKEWLAVIEENFSSIPNLVGLSGPIYTTNEASFFDKVAQASIRWGEAIFRTLSRKVYFSGQNCAARKEAFVKIGGFNTSLLAGEDVDFAKRLARVGKLKYDSRMKVYVSPRRFQQGKLKTLIRYTWVTILVMFGRKPTGFKHIR